MLAAINVANNPVFQNMQWAALGGKAGGDWWAGGKGKGQKGGSDKGKGGQKGQQQKDQQQQTPKGNQGKAQTYPQCKCCGMTNHPYSECRHRDKKCGTCGKVGHLAVMCRHNQAANADNSKADKAGAAAAEATAEDQKNLPAMWICAECGFHHRNWTKRSCKQC